MTVPCGDVSALPRGLDVAGLLGNIDTVLHQELVALLKSQCQNWSALDI